MAVSMTFYSNFSKRENSTKQPSGGTQYDVVFKDAFSIIGGTVKLQVNFNTAKNYTAAKYGNNFYKVVDVVSTTNNIVEITLTLDALATYKSSIASYSCLLSRTPVDSEINYLPDDTIVNNLNVVHTRSFSSVLNIVSASFNSGSFILYLAGSNYNLGFMFTLNEINDFFDKFFAINNARIEDLLKLKWIPVRKSDVPSGSYVAITSIKMPGYTVEGISCYKLTNLSVIYATQTYNIHSDIYTTSYYSDARKYDNNYTSTVLELFHKKHSIDSVYLSGTQLRVLSVLDATTGIIDCEVSVLYSDNKQVFLLNDSCDFSVEIPLNIAKTDVSAISSSILAAASNVVTLNPVGAVQSSLSLGNNIYKPPTTGAVPAGGLIANEVCHYIGLNIVQYGSTEKSPSTNGYPYYKVNTISAINANGFYRFENPSIDIAALSSVRDKVNGFLSQGFYYE